MKETTTKVRKRALSEIESFGQLLAEEGLRCRDLEDKLISAVNSRIKVFYTVKNRSEHISGIIKRVIFNQTPDSKAELIFYNMLKEKSVKFDFQYKIGPYRVDFLIDKFLVVELDGPQHNQERDATRDKYLRKMGYKVLRVPIWILAINEQSVLDEIEEIINS